MNPSEEQWNRWLDDSLSSEEAATMATAVAEDEALAAEKAFFTRLSVDLKETFPAERTPPFADFFNSHLQKRIRDLAEEANEASQKRQRLSWWPDWFRLSWAAPLAAAAVVVITLIQIGVIGGRNGSQITYAYTPDESVTALTDFNKDTNAMIVRLEGMEPLPEEFDLILAEAGDDTKEPAQLVADAGEERHEEDGDEEEFVFVGPQIQFTTHRSTY